MTAMAIRLRPARRWVVESTIAGPLITLVVVFVLFALFVPNFLTMRSISGIVNAASRRVVQVPFHNTLRIGVEPGGGEARSDQR